jgi:hypothetical protein
MKTQKLLIIGPNLFFHSPAQATAHSPELTFHIMNMSQDTSVSLSVCGTMVQQKKIDGLGFRIDNQALITQVTTFLRLSPSFNHILDRFINIHSSGLSKRLGVL